MINKRRNNKGITLLALVVTIIIMIILAVVSINLAVGDDGLLGQAKKTREKADDVKIKESLEQVLIGFQMSEFVDEGNGLERYLSTKIADGKIDNYLSSTDGEIVILEKDGRFFQWKEDEKKNKTYYIADMDESLNDVLEEDARLSGNVRTPTTIITQQTLDETGGFTFANGSTYVVLDPDLNGDDFDFHIPAGNPVTIKIAYNMTIDNSKTPNRSAIDIDEGGTLNLYVYGNVSVNSSYGTQGATGEMGRMEQNKGGDGAHAGIHVPATTVYKADGTVTRTYATLNLYGTGTIVAYGGNATAGGAGTSQVLTQSSSGNGGGGGGGAGAGIGGNGGKGGESNSTVNGNGVSYPQVAGDLVVTDGGRDGYSGEDCGNVNIYDSVKVYAYGGAGSKTVPSLNVGTNSGGSGYPAAGIGGGGAGGGGGDWAGGAGGYVGIWGDNGDCNRPDGHNGISYYRRDFPDIKDAGSGLDAASYFTPGDINPWVQTSSYWINNPAKNNITAPKVGGMGGGAYSNGLFATSCGGKAGNGGVVTAAKNTIIYAYNGDRITNGDYTSPIYDYDKNGNKLSSKCKVYTIYGTNKKTSPCKIFAQAGILREIRYNNICWKEREPQTPQEALHYKQTSGYDYFFSIMGNQVNSSIRNIRRAVLFTDYNEYVIRSEKSIGKTSYINPETNDFYGIGSGAGYIEVSNGTYSHQ